MEDGYKLAGISEVKTTKEKGVVEAEFSVFGNLDSDGDVVVKGAFEEAWAKNPNPAVVWTHMWQIPPIGETLELTETETGAKGISRYFLDDHEIARQAYAGVKSGAIKNYSYHYVVAEGGSSKEYSKEHGKEVQYLTKFSDMFEWGPTLVGANRATQTLEVKSPMMRLLLDPDNLTDDEFKEAILAVGLKLGARNSNKDSERLQMIHDLSLENGAVCPDGKSDEHTGFDPDYLRRVADVAFASPH